MYLQSEPRLGSTGLGLCVVPKRVTIRKLVCTDADLEAIGAEMGKGRGLVIREVRIEIEDAVRRAVVLIERAESQLKKPRATGQAGDAMRERFRDAFGTAPEFVPTWRPAGQTWDVGGVVRERLRCAAKIMSEGDIEFVAWGPGSCPFGNWANRPWAVVQAATESVLVNLSGTRRAGQTPRRWPRRSFTSACTSTSTPSATGWRNGRTTQRHATSASCSWVAASRFHQLWTYRVRRRSPARQPR